MDGEPFLWEAVSKAVTVPALQELIAWAGGGGPMRKKYRVLGDLLEGALNSLEGRASEGAPEEGAI